MLSIGQKPPAWCGTPTSPTQKRLDAYLSAWRAAGGAGTLKPVPAPMSDAALAAKGITGIEYHDVGSSLRFSFYEIRGKLYAREFAWVDAWHLVGKAPQVG